MGESRGGGGGARRATTGNISSMLARELKDEGREPQSIRVERITDGQYAVTLIIHGEPEPEAYFLKVV